MTNKAEQLSDLQLQLVPGARFTIEGGVAIVKEHPSEPEHLCSYKSQRDKHIPPTQKGGTWKTVWKGTEVMCPMFSSRHFWKMDAPSDLCEGCQVNVALQGKKGAHTPPTGSEAGQKTARAVGEYQRIAVELSGEQVPCSIFDFDLK